jgi:hypothetical protein
MKKNYSTPTTEEVQLLTNASLMNIVEGSNTQEGIGGGESDSEDEGAAANRGNWGNLW